MEKVYSLEVEPMTEESFEPFGVLINPQERPPDRRMIIPLDFHAEGRTTLSSIWQPCEGLAFWEMERHFGVTQTFFQLSGSPMVVAAAAPYVDAGQMKITRGKKVVEVRPNLDWGKGQAIGKIREECGDNPLPMFFGDDETDEDGFAAVQDAGGLAVYVGPVRGRTLALHQLDSPAEVGQVLELLAMLD